MTATTRRATKPQPTSQPKQEKRAKLRVVDPAALRRRRWQRSLLVVLTALVTAVVFGVVLLYGQIVEGQRELDGLRGEIAEAEAERARLERAVAEASTPDAIVQRAFQLGMVRALEPEYLIAIRPAGEPTGAQVTAGPPGQVDPSASASTSPGPEQPAAAPPASESGQ